MDTFLLIIIITLVMICAVLLLALTYIITTLRSVQIKEFDWARKIIIVQQSRIEAHNNDLDDSSNSKSGSNSREIRDKETGRQLEIVKQADEAKLRVEKKSLRERFKISFTHPELLSKRFSSLFLVQIYLPEMKDRALENIRREFKKQRALTYTRKSDLSREKNYRLTLFSPEITFSQPVIKKLDQSVNVAHFLAKPNDSCHPGLHHVILSISDSETNSEYESISFSVQVTDFAFDHVSRPMLSGIMSIALGVGSLTMFTLSLLEQIDKTFGLAAGAASITLVGVIYMRFQSLYQTPKITNTP